MILLLYLFFAQLPLIAGDASQSQLFPLKKQYEIGDCHFAETAPKQRWLLIYDDTNKPGSKSPMISPEKKDSRVVLEKKDNAVVARNLFGNKKEQEPEEQFDEKQHQKGVEKAIRNGDLRRSGLAQTEGAQQKVQIRTPLSHSAPTRPTRLMPIFIEERDENDLSSTELRCARTEVLNTLKFVTLHAKQYKFLKPRVTGWANIYQQITQCTDADFRLHYPGYQSPTDLAFEACNARMRAERAIEAEKIFSSSQ